MELNFPKMSVGFKTSVSRSQICYMRYRYCYSIFSFFLICWQIYHLCRMYCPDSPSLCCEKQREDFFWHPAVISDFSRTAMTRVSTRMVVSLWAWICSQNNGAAGCGDFKYVSASLAAAAPTADHPPLGVSGYLLHC